MSQLEFIAGFGLGIFAGGWLVANLVKTVVKSMMNKLEDDIKQKAIEEYIYDLQNKRDYK